MISMQISYSNAKYVVNEDSEVWPAWAFNGGFRVNMISIEISYSNTKYGIR